MKNILTKNLSSQKINCDGSKEKTVLTAISEHSLEIIVNGKSLATLSCTPADLKELVIGWLFTERVIKTASDVTNIDFNEDSTQAKVTLSGNNTDKNTIEETQKNSANTKDSQITGNFSQPENSSDSSNIKIQPKEIFNLVQKFAEDSKLHKTTQGTHSCILASKGQTLYQVEDIGRHNCIDKAFGHALISGIELSKCVVFTTGRISSDMVEKVVSAEVPVLVSKAVPTDKAAELAKKHGLTLVCRAWPDSFEVILG